MTDRPISRARSLSEADRSASDFNVRDEGQFIEKLRCIHRNPVKRGLCKRAEDWEWSSYRQYATGCTGTVAIECEWAARKRERAAGRLCPEETAPLKPKDGLSGPPAQRLLRQAPSGAFQRHTPSANSHDP